MVKKILAGLSVGLLLLCGCGVVVSMDLLTVLSVPIAGIPDIGGGCGPRQCPPGSDWVAPVPHGVVSGYRTPDRPDHQGVDFGSPRGSQVRAVSAGKVLSAECSAWLHNAWYGCDLDGSPQVSGCGWHVTIAHANDWMSVYCHFERAPTVTEGQAVAAGDVIGVTGTTGNSSGPHLHFEIHHSLVWEPASAVAPIGFFAAKGISL